MHRFTLIYPRFRPVWDLGKANVRQPGETNRRSTVGEDETALCCVQLHTCALQVFGRIDFGEQLRGEESKVSGSRHIILREYSIQSVFYCSPLLLSGSLDRGAKSTIASGLYEGHSMDCYSLLSTLSLSLSLSAHLTLV